MISIIFYDPGIPSVARYDVFHYSWIVLKQGMLLFLDWGRMGVNRFLPLSGLTPEDGFALLSCYIIKAKVCIGMCLFNQSSCRYMWML
jgi:hypothetical protein